MGHFHCTHSPMCREDHFFIVRPLSYPVEHLQVSWKIVTTTTRKIMRSLLLVLSPMYYPYWVWVYCRNNQSNWVWQSALKMHYFLGRREFLIHCQCMKPYWIFQMRRAWIMTWILGVWIVRIGNDGEDWPQKWWTKAETELYRHQTLDVRGKRRTRANILMVSQTPRREMAKRLLLWMAITYPEVKSSFAAYPRIGPLLT
jgi:hypothetical protein